MERTDFQKLLGAGRKTFSVSVQAGTEEVTLEFNYSRKSQQAIMFDCGASKETLQFAFALSEGQADFSMRPEGDELDLIENAVPLHFMRHELVKPELSENQVQELLDNIDPTILRDIFSQIKSKAFPNVAKK